MMNKLAAKNLVHRYDGQTAVAGLDLDLCVGQAVALVGPNGAGKSTTLEILSGCLAPDEGSVSVNGENLYGPSRDVRRAIGYLPDRPPIYPELRVLDYLMFCATLRGVAKAKRREACDRALQRCGLAGQEQRVIGHLSRGYQQRLGIAQAIVHEPTIILLDEPTVALDPLQLQEVRTLICSLREHHAVLLSTHMLSEATACCNQVVIMLGGRLLHREELTPQDTGLEQRFLSIIAAAQQAPSP